MEYLDGYTEDGKLIGPMPRDEVHEKGIWHNTVHCWLYDNDKNVYFQVRSDSHKLYTTSSGHVSAGETLKEAFGREVKEELGIDISYDKAELLKMKIWKADREKNGKKLYDRCFSNVHILNIETEPTNLVYADGEVEGVVKLNVIDTLKLFHNEVDSIKGIFIGNNGRREERTITKDDFLVFDFEDINEKYGYILEAIRDK